MAHTSDKYTIAKLNNDNYFNWKFRMEMLLKEKEVWTTISGEIPSTQSTDWKRMDEKALSTIALTIEDNQIQHVRDCKHAKLAWEALRDFHHKDTAGSRLRILRSIMKLRADESSNMENFVQTVTELFQKLMAYGAEIKIEFLMAGVLLGSLPSSYDSLTTALEARNESELTSSLVRSKIVEEYRRRTDRDGHTSEATALKIAQSSQKQNRFCTYCKKNGHDKKYCRKLAKDKKSKSGGGNNNNNSANMVGQPSSNLLFSVSSSVAQQVNEFVFAVGDPKQPKVNGFVMDTGATTHTCYDKSKFEQLDMNHHENVKVANGYQITSSSWQHSYQCHE